MTAFSPASRDPNPEMREMVAGLSSIGKADPIFNCWQQGEGVSKLKSIPQVSHMQPGRILAEGCSGQKVSGILGFLARVETLVVENC